MILLHLVFMFLPLLQVGNSAPGAAPVRSGAPAKSPPAGAAAVTAAGRVNADAAALDGAAPASRPAYFTTGRNTRLRYDTVP